MFEHRQQLAPEFPPPLRDDSCSLDDVDGGDTLRAALLNSLACASALRRALPIVPLAVIGCAIAWFLSLEPSQDVTAKPAVEAKQERTRTAPPIELPPPTRQEATEAKPAPAPAATTPVAPAPPSAVAAVPSRPLSKDEIKELQGRLGAAGFAAGPIDGVVGPQTQTALRRYAQSRNLAKPEASPEMLLRLRSESQPRQ